MQDLEEREVSYSIDEEKAEPWSVEHVLTITRNIMAGMAAVLFLASFALEEVHLLLRGIGYFCGAGAYFSEILALTDGFSKKIPKHELFMAFCFGPLYLLMGLSYMLEA